MIDHHKESREKWLREQQTHSAKLDDAIAWLRGRNRYCLDSADNLNFYRPVHGYPMVPK